MSKTQAVSIVFALAALPTAPAWAGEFPKGVYEATGAPVTMSFGDHGKLRLSQNGALKVAGAYKVEGDRIQITDERGPWACAKAGERTGSYQWRGEKGRLAFTTVADGCKLRVFSLTNYAWRRR